MTAATRLETLRTADGGLHPLQECRLELAGREWRVLHAGIYLTPAQEAAYLRDLREKRSLIPYGLTLWPSAVALAHEIAARGASWLRGRTVLELGAGTGLPGLVAASLGARVVQTDRDPVALELCRRNAARNAAEPPADVTQRLGDWEAWEDGTRYDRIIGSDVLYADPMHPHLRRILKANLVPGGRVLLSDPFRAPSIAFLESLQEQGWGVTFSRWSLGEEAGDARPVGVFELIPP